MNAIFVQLKPADEPVYLPAFVLLGEVLIDLIAN